MHMDLHWMLNIDRINSIYSWHKDTIFGLIYMDYTRGTWIPHGYHNSSCCIFICLRTIVQVSGVKYIIFLRLWMGICVPPPQSRASCMLSQKTKTVLWCCKNTQKEHTRTTIEFCGATTLLWVVLHTKIYFWSLGHFWSINHEISETCYSTPFSLSKNSFSNTSRKSVLLNMITVVPFLSYMLKWTLC